MVAEKLTVALAVWLSLTAAPASAGKPKLPPPSTNAEEAERDLAKACKTRNAERLWSLFSERFRGTWDSEAARYRASLTPKDLKTTYHYKGEPKKFDGRALLLGSLRRGVGENPCDDVKNWNIVTHALARSHHVFAMKRKDGFTFGLKFMNVDGHWYLDEITKVQAPASDLPPEPVETTPDEATPAPGDPGPTPAAGGSTSPTPGPTP